MNAKTLLLMLVALSAQAAVNNQIDLSIVRIQDAKEILGKWSFSNEWSGYMGMAIEFDKDGYKYWFYSDVKSKDEPKFPLVGKWKITDGVLFLTAPADGVLYATDWMKVIYNGQVGLIDPENLKIMMIHDRTPTNRWIQKLEGATPSWPILNLPGK